MSKDEVVELLKKQGYNATNESGVVIISIKDSSFTEQDVRNKLKELNYQMSFGITGIKSNPLKSTTVTDKPRKEHSVPVIPSFSEDNDSQLSFFI